MSFSYILFLIKLLVDFKLLIMNNLGVQEMNAKEMEEVDGGEPVLIAIAVVGIFLWFRKRRRDRSCHY